mmetsp:Transcript_95792/g.256008  ORF Transcript_95792/g.256008 Transcript_95792/m.256008 type:complete len:441 (-) Transcript_95792:242-1564(-)
MSGMDVDLNQLGLESVQSLQSLSELQAFVRRAVQANAGVAPDESTMQFKKLVLKYGRAGTRYVDLEYDIKDLSWGPAVQAASATAPAVAAPAPVTVAAQPAAPQGYPDLAPPQPIAPAAEARAAPAAPAALPSNFADASDAIGECLQQLPHYQNHPVVARDVRRLQQRFSALMPRVRSINNQGTTLKLLYLDGTIPITYKGGQYNIPVTVYLDPPYPAVPPRCFVTPTSTMGIKPNHPCVSAEGRVGLSAINDWNLGTRDLLVVVEAMDGAFSSNPPVFAKPAAQPTAPAATGPQYAQPQYAQPVRAQAGYAQPAYAQPVYAQPAYGQPVYAQPQYAQPSYAGGAAPAMGAVAAAAAAGFVAGEIAEHRHHHHHHRWGGDYVEVDRGMFGQERIIEVERGPFGGERIVEVDRGPFGFGERVVETDIGPFGNVERIEIDRW